MVYGSGFRRNRRMQIGGFGVSVRVGGMVPSSPSPPPSSSPSLGMTN